ncbi:MAG: hypothetical protein KC492_41985, partial [Myxococcales bacterium]|nr:hypothetical protein [Myxococcales bacterium]
MDNDPQTALDYLPNQMRRYLRQVLTGLQEVLQDRLLCVALTGGSSIPGCAEGSPSPVVAVLVSDLAIEDLYLLAKQTSDALKHDIQVHVLTAHEFDRSRDVFALEVADWRDRHTMLYGEDLLANTVVTPTHLRASLERAWRGFRMRLRVQLLDALSRGLAGPNAQRAIERTFERLVTLAHHTVCLNGGVPDGDEARLLEQLARIVDMDAEPLTTALLEFRQKGRYATPTELFDRIDHLATRAADHVDRFDVAR